jgi:hypothetical protein
LVSAISFLSNLRRAIVKFRVAIGTSRYEIAFFVVSQIASGLDVMHLEIFHAATMLATPAVAG